MSSQGVLLAPRLDRLDDHNHKCHHVLVISRKQLNMDPRTSKNNTLIQTQKRIPKNFQAHDGRNPSVHVVFRPEEKQLSHHPRPLLGPVGDRTALTTHTHRGRLNATSNDLRGEPSVFVTYPESVGANCPCNRHVARPDAIFQDVLVIL